MTSSSPDRLERVLIVEDDANLSRLLVEEIEDAGYSVNCVDSAESAIRELEEASYDLVVSDLRLPGADGRKLLDRIQGFHLPPAFVMITAFGSIPQAVDALKAGADDFLAKPLDLDHLTLSVERALETRRMRMQIREFNELLGENHFHGLIGNSRPMSVLFDTIRRVADGPGPVLITGESGTGKELVARAIHRESDRATEPFLAVNCAGVPGELLESEFFGHEKGSFTGAHDERTGLFVDADGGTLFLDEVGAMPVELQAKLLRVLQEERVRPVGSSTGRPVDVRIIASTNRNLEEAVEEGTFREDLFYRLETFQISCPPLRERGDDLDLLVAHFIDRYGSDRDPAVSDISVEALDRLRRYRFPGNVRELENAVQRAVTFCDSDTVQPEHLPPRIREERHSAHDLSSGTPVSSLVEDGRLPPLDRIEHRYIRLVLDRVDGNKRRAAEILGISRQTLYRRLEKWEDEQA